MRKGTKHSEKTRIKMSKNHWNCSGKNNPMYGIKLTGINAPNFGKKFSEEYRKKISDGHKGQIPWIKGKKHSKKTIEKLIKSHTGYVMPEEQKRKISLANKEKIHKGSFKKRCKPIAPFKKGHIPWNKDLPHTKETINKIKQARAKQIFPIKDTKIEVKIQNFLKQLGIEFYTHQYMKEIEHSYQCDILIPSKNMIIECYGDYWHKYPLAREIDNIRCKELREKGFKVFIFWEREIKELDVDTFSNKINGIKGGRIK